MGSITPSNELPEMQQAVQYSAKSNSISVNTVPLPTPSKDQLLIKVASASLCHSDLMLLEPNDTGIVMGDGTPITIGHEATGTILSVPDSCTDPTLKVGARIGFLCPERVCYECAGCQIHNAWCEDGKAVMSGFGRDGFFQEYVVSHWRNAIVLPENLDFHEAAPLFCAGVTSWQGVIKAKINPGEWMAIVGCGGLGHLGIQYAKALGYKVIGIDLVDSQLEEAKASGADHTFNPVTDKDYVDKIKEITGGGCHAAVNYTNSKPAYDSTPILLRTGGIMMVVGIPQKPLTLNALDVALGKFRIGAASNSTPQEMGPCIEFSAKHNIKPHVTFYKIDQIQEMIDTMHAGKARGRLAVKFD
ncbi:NAD(P)-binding Rossmann-fold containing protein-11 [Coleophoma crateriformis]|uniref:NAD(P)-binding Rossmann-fold containing protein-11 n=1 Tax=Coleophoma crateriformis TaxID=565419 RepID=A0A3D8RDZ5_9HELO|nr:NAD(P)-binding Rossmann-fold containing protein-11 [Coleophoma crateriformis]